MDSTVNKALQEFLDSKQYTQRSVRRYEWIFGKTFLSTGGLTTTQKYVTKLDLKPGQKVLDVGCGIGGHSFYMAENFGVNVLGVDLSVNMMTVAQEYLSEKHHLSEKVKFVLCDVTKTTFEKDSFDAVYSRDALLHIAEKKTLFKHFHKWLKPGGRLLFTDYTCSEKKPSVDFERYISDRGYNLVTNNHYEKLLHENGFVNIRVEDITSDFMAALNSELDKLRKNKERFLMEFSEEDFKYLEDTWTSKIRRVQDGDQTWTMCYAEK